MSDETEVIEEASPEPKSRMKMIAIVAACALAGGSAGAFAVAPLVGGAFAEAGTEQDGGSHGGGGHGKATGPYVHSVDNLVLNPLGTNGTRFLLVTAAFEVSNDKLVEQMRGRDSEIRDLLNRTLGSRTVEQLGDLSEREPLREDLRLQLEGMFGAGSVRKVYLPQFVIQ